MGWEETATVEKKMALQKSPWMRGPEGRSSKRYRPGTWLTLLGFRFCLKARGNAGKVNKGEITICFHLSFEISPNARDSNIPTTTAASILTRFARKKDWGTAQLSTMCPVQSVNHVPGLYKKSAQPSRAGESIPQDDPSAGGAARQRSASPSS
jgi:hypothetical protein